MKENECAVLFFNSWWGTYLASVSTCRRAFFVSQRGSNPATPITKNSTQPLTGAAQGWGRLRGSLLCRIRLSRRNKCRTGLQVGRASSSSPKGERAQETFISNASDCLTSCLWLRDAGSKQISRLFKLNFAVNCWSCFWACTVRAVAILTVLKKKRNCK